MHPTFKVPNNQRLLQICFIISFYISNRYWYTFDLKTFDDVVLLVRPIVQTSQVFRERARVWAVLRPLNAWSPGHITVRERAYYVIQEHCFSAMLAP